MPQAVPTRYSRLATRADGLTEWTLDYPGAPINKLNEEVWRELEAVADWLAAEPAVKAVVLASAKPNVFLAGADLEELRAVDEATALHMSRRAHRVLGKIEACGKPVVAAVDGAALGGGMELLLACHAVVATENPKAKLGLPETKLGLLPAAGGTQRLVRRVAPEVAADLVVSGKAFDTARGRELGLVAEIVPAAGLVEAARRRALDLAARGGYRPAWAPAPIEAPEAFFLRRALALDRGDRRFESQLAALSVLVFGGVRPFAEGLAAEAEAFGVLAPGEAARELVARFLGGERI